MWRIKGRGGRQALLPVTEKAVRGQGAGRRALRRECREWLVQMPLPRPFSLDGLVANIEAERGRRITLVAIPDHLLASTSVCGLWLRLDDAPVDLILYAGGTSGFHRTRIILHELAHLWCDDAAEAGFDDLCRLLPDFPPAALRRLSRRGRVLARHRYDSPVEMRAEMLADLLHHEAYSTDDIDDPVLRSLDEDLSRPTVTARSSALRKTNDVCL